MRHKRIPGSIKLILLYDGGFYCTLQQLMPCTPTIDTVHYNNIYPALKRYSPSTPNKTSSRPIISCSRSLNEESIWAGRKKRGTPYEEEGGAPDVVGRKEESERMVCAYIYAVPRLLAGPGNGGSGPERVVGRQSQGQEGGCAEI